MNLKLKIKDLKKARDEAIAAKDHTKLERIRRQIHNVKHELRKVFG
jgi:DNA replication initiation complex subunit (GINS family)